MYGLPFITVVSVGSIPLLIMFFYSQSLNFFLTFFSYPFSFLPSLYFPYLPNCMFFIQYNINIVLRVYSSIPAGLGPCLLVSHVRVWASRFLVPPHPSPFSSTHILFTLFVSSWQCSGGESIKIIFITRLYYGLKLLKVHTIEHW